MWWKIVLSFLAAALPQLFTIGYAQQGSYGTSATFAATGIVGGGLAAYLTGLLKQLPSIGSWFSGDPGEIQTAYVELKDAGLATLALIKAPTQWEAQREFLVQVAEAEIAVGAVAIADEEWSAAAATFLALTKSKLDAAAPKTAAGKPVPPGMVSFTELAKS